MHFTTHAAVGAGLGTLIGHAVPTPWSGLLALGAGIVSHAVLDAVPHKDSPSLPAAVGDVLVGTAVTLWAVGMGGSTGGTVWGIGPWSIPPLLGALGGVVPDLEVVLVHLGIVHKDRLLFPSHTGLTPHPGLPAPWGFLIQLPFWVAGMGLTLLIH